MSFPCRQRGMAKPIRPLRYKTADAPPGAGVHAIQGRREYMEDRTFYASWTVPGGNPTIPAAARRYEAFGVLDGHGGSQAVDYAKRWLPWILAQHVSAALGGRDVPPRGLMKRVIERSFVALQEQMRVYNDASAERRRFFDVCGTTASIMLRNARYAYVANLGDSRTVACIRGGGGAGAPPKAVALTRDHKPNGKAERARILRLGGAVALDGPHTWRVEPVGLATSRSLGDLDSRQLPNGGRLDHGAYLVSPQPDVTILDLRTLQTKGTAGCFVFATDGLWDDLSNDEACCIACGARGPQAAARLLVQTAYKKGSEDNITALVVPFGSPAAAVRRAL